MGIYDVEPNELIEKTAEELKKIGTIKPAEWAAYVKTSIHKERPPSKEDWWYFRAASVLRKLARFGPIGVSKLRRQYGGRKSRGVAPPHFYKGSGNILRKIFQQLEKAGFVENVKEGKHKGRMLTQKGKEFLNNISYQISGKPEKKIEKKKKIEKIEVKKEKTKTEEKKEEVKEEELIVDETNIRKMVEKTKKFMKEEKKTAEDLLKES